MGHSHVSGCWCDLAVMIDQPIEDVSSWMVCSYVGWNRDFPYQLCMASCLVLFIAQAIVTIISWLDQNRWCVWDLSIFLLCDCCYFDLCCKWTVFHLKFIKQLNEVKDISCGSIISVVDWLFDQLHIDQWPQLLVVLMLWCTADKHSQSLIYCSNTNNHWYP